MAFFDDVLRLIISLGLQKDQPPILDEEELGLDDGLHFNPETPTEQEQEELPSPTEEMYPEEVAEHLPTGTESAEPEEQTPAEEDASQEPEFGTPASVEDTTDPENDDTWLRELPREAPQLTDETEPTTDEEGVEAPQRNSYLFLQTKSIPVYRSAFDRIMDEERRRLRALELADPRTREREFLHLRSLVGTREPRRMRVGSRAEVPEERDNPPVYADSVAGDVADFQNAIFAVAQEMLDDFLEDEEMLELEDAEDAEELDYQALDDFVENYLIEEGTEDTFFDDDEDDEVGV